MQPTLSKKAQYSTTLRFLLAAPLSNYGFYYSSQFLSLFSPFLFYKNLSVFNQTFLHILRPYQPHSNSLIGSEKASHLLFTACRRAKEENKAETGLLKKSSKVDANEAYLHSSSKDLSLDVNSLSSKDNINDPDN